MSYLLDTNVLSELRKSKSNRAVERWYETVSAEELFVSVLVLGELRRGVERLRRKDRSAASAIDRWLRSVQRDFADRILPITVEIADEWGRLGVPDPIPDIDGLLAATARVHGLTLVTRNTSHVERAGVRVLNPFESGR